MPDISNYMVRKVNTNLTQIVHRILLRKDIPPQKPVDIIVTKRTKFEVDNDFPDTLEPNLIDVEMIEEKTSSDHNRPEPPYTHLMEDTSSIPFAEEGRSEYREDENKLQRNERRRKP